MAIVTDQTLFYVSILQECRHDFQSLCNHCRRFSPLHVAAAGGQAKVVQWLLDNVGCRVETRTIDGVTPMLTAAAHGHLMVVKQLLKRGADACAVSKTGYVRARCCEYVE